MDSAPSESPALSRHEIIEAVRHANTSAKRLPAIVGTSTWSTPWDRAHDYLNTLLDQLIGR